MHSPSWIKTQRLLLVFVAELPDCA